MKSTILGIESSCDETAASIISEGEIISNVVASQESIHQKWGGIVPEQASRKHLENIAPVLEECMQNASMKWGNIDAIAVSNRPGLMGSLMVGVCAAKTIAYSLQKPIVPVHHLHAHLASTLIGSIKPPALPALGLVVSGGHTNLYWIKAWTSFELISSTLDDAAGEAFDKGARILGLGYPGGPLLEELASQGSAQAGPSLPIAMKKKKSSLLFSFSGIKTALQNIMKEEHAYKDADIAASYQEAIIDSIMEKILIAIEKKRPQSFLAAGGVCANKEFRKKMCSSIPSHLGPHIAPLSLCTDNAAMIAMLGALLWEEGKQESVFSIHPNPRPEKFAPPSQKS